jgi:hypothetical protein
LKINKVSRVAEVRQPYRYDFVDAEEVLTREQVEFMGKTYAISRPAVSECVEPSRVLRLSNLPASFSTDALELLLERDLGRSFSEPPEIQIDSTKCEAIVTLHELSGNTHKKINLFNMFNSQLLQTLTNSLRVKLSCSYHAPGCFDLYRKIHH